MVSLRASEAAITVITRYRIATPKATIKNTGVNVITAVICKKVAMIPIIKLVTMAIAEQSYLQSQLKKDINFSPPIYRVCENVVVGENGNTTFRGGEKRYKKVVKNKEK